MHPVFCIIEEKLRGLVFVKALSVNFTKINEIIECAHAYQCVQKKKKDEIQSDLISEVTLYSKVIFMLNINGKMLMVLNNTNLKLVAAYFSFIICHC